MSQSATLYRITPETFRVLEANPDGFDLMNKYVAYETFINTFDGLLYILARQQPEEVKQLLWKIFYPGSSVGSNPDAIDFNDPESVKQYKQPAAFYATPAVVAAINQVIREIDETYFRNNFHPEEMNTNGIYPWIWGEGYCDYESILQELQTLQQFFQRVAQEKSYVLSYVG